MFTTISLPARMVEELEEQIKERESEASLDTEENEDL